MESKDTLTRYAVKQFRNAAMLWLALASMCLMWAQSAHAQDMAAIRAACTADAKKFCAGVQPGGGRVVACLKEHKDELSDRCKKAAGLPEIQVAVLRPAMTVLRPRHRTPMPIRVLRLRRQNQPRRKVLQPSRIPNKSAADKLHRQTTLPTRLRKVRGTHHHRYRT